MGTVHYLVKKQLERVLERGNTASLVVLNDGKRLPWGDPGLATLYVNTQSINNLNLTDEGLTGIAFVNKAPFNINVPWSAVKRVTLLAPPVGGGSPLRNAP